MTWFCGAAKAHEFWIDPLDHIVAPGDNIVAELFVGQDYEGARQSFLPLRFKRFDFAFEDAVSDVPGTVGDRPALNMAAPGEGLVVVVHETTNSTLTYTEFAKFEAFVTHKDATWTLEAHQMRGLPEKGFKEVYSRYAKSLVAVGDGTGADVEAGMETELVALENPYTDNMSDGIDVRLMYQGAPRADAQIEVFAKATDGTVAVSTVRTDETGVATVPVQPGQRYMLDSVVLRQPVEGDAAWESLWANLTFAVPE